MAEAKEIIDYSLKPSQLAVYVWLSLGFNCDKLEAFTGLDFDLHMWADSIRVTSV